MKITLSSKRYVEISLQLAVALMLSACISQETREEGRAATSALDEASYRYAECIRSLGRDACESEGAAFDAERDRVEEALSFWESVIQEATTTESEALLPARPTKDEVHHEKGHTHHHGH